MNFYNVLVYICVYLIYRNIYVQCINTREGLRSPLGNFDNNTNRSAFKPYVDGNGGTGRFGPEFSPRNIQNIQSGPKDRQFASQASNRTQQFPPNQFPPKEFDPKLLNSGFSVPSGTKSDLKLSLDSLNVTPKRQQHVFHQPTQLNLITLDISKRRSSNVVVYHFDKATKTHTFTTREPWLINRLVNEGKTVWVAGEKYGKQAIVSRDANNEPFLTVLFPVDEVKPSVIGIDLMLFDVKKVDKKAPQPDFKVSEFKIENNEAKPTGTNVASANSTPSVKSDKNVTGMDQAAPVSKQGKIEPVSEPPQPPEPKPRTPEAQPSAEQNTPSVPQPPEAKQEPVSKQSVSEQPVDSQKPELQKPEEPVKLEPAPMASDTKEAVKPNANSNSASSGGATESSSAASKTANEPTQAVDNPPADSLPHFSASVTPSTSGTQTGTTEGVKAVNSDSESSSSDSETDGESEKVFKSSGVPVKTAPNDLGGGEPLKVMNAKSAQTSVKASDAELSESDVGETGAHRAESSDAEYEPSVVGEPVSKQAEQPFKPYPAETEVVKTDGIKPTALDINNGSSTDFYDYFMDGDSAIFEPKEEYVFVSVQDGKAMKTIWKANSEKEYANKVVRTHSTFSNQSKLSVFLVAGPIKHFITRGDEWKERSNEVAIDIDVLANAHEYEYRSFSNSLFFHSRYDFKFKTVKQKNTVVWSSGAEQHANAVIVTDVDAKTKLLVIQFSSPDMLLFRKQGGKAWQQDLDFKPTPIDLDIQYLKTARDDIFTHIPSQGNLIRLIRQHELVVWRAPEPEQYAKKVVVDRLDDGSVVLTIYCLDGQVVRLSNAGPRSLTSRLTGAPNKFVQIGSSAKIPVTININSVTSCRAYNTFQSGNIRTFRVRDDYVFVGVRGSVVGTNASSGSGTGVSATNVNSGTESNATNDGTNTTNDTNVNQQQQKEQKQELIWHVQPSEYANKYSTKVEFITYEKYEAMYELAVHMLDGSTRRFFKHREAPWSLLDPARRLPVSVNILSQYDSYKFTVRRNNSIKRITAKPGIAFESVIEWSDAKHQVWFTNQPEQFADRVEFDTAANKLTLHLLNGELRKLKKGADGKWVKDFGVAEPNTPLLVAPDKANPAPAGADNAKSVGSGASIRNWFRRGAKMGDPPSQIKLYALDPKNPSKRVELAKSLYQMTQQTQNKYFFVLKPDSKCAEVVYLDLIFDTFNPDKLLTTKPVSIWRSASGSAKPKFPKSLAFLYPNKLLINFADSFIAKEKTSDGSWVSRDFDVRFFYSSNDDDDSRSVNNSTGVDDDAISVTSFGESSPVQLPQNAYQLKRMSGERYDYRFNPGVKCSEVKFYYKRLDPKDPTRVVSGYRTVWKLGQFGLNEFPVAVSVRSASRVIVEFQNSFFVCERGSYDKWLVKQTYLELFTVQGNQLDPTLYKVDVNSEGLLYTLKARARCAKVNFVESASDPVKSGAPSTQSQRLWTHSAENQPGANKPQNKLYSQFPSSILYKNSGTITIFFDGFALDFERDADGNWVSQQSYDYADSASSDSASESSRPGPNAKHPQSNTIHLKPSQGASSPSNQDTSDQSDSQSESEAKATTSYSFRSASYPSAVFTSTNTVPGSGSDSASATRQTGPSQADVSEHKAGNVNAGAKGKIVYSNVVPLHSSEFPRDVAIEIDKNSESRHFEVFSNPGREFFLYQFDPNTKVTKITHAEHPMPSDHSSKTQDLRSDVKTVWAYGSGGRPPSYPQSIFYNKLTLTFIIIFNNYNLILTKENGQWVVSNTTKPL